MVKEKTVKKEYRSFILVVFIIFIFAAVVVRFVQVQILDHSYYSRIAEKQYERREILPAERGAILDRNGNTLAINQFEYQFGIYKPEVRNKKALANVFAIATGKKSGIFLKRLGKKSTYVQFASHLPEKSAKKIIEGKYSGVRYSYDFARTYPLKNRASHILGFCGTEDIGLEGIEKHYDSVLSGVDGERFVFTDGLRRSFVRTDYPEIVPQRGKNITLTLDLNYQSVIEEELSKIMYAHNAKGAMGVLIDINNGDILAMSSLPDFDPNNLKKISLKSLRNRCITDIFDPGSIFKPITAAALLQEGKAYPGKKVYCNEGKLKIYKTVIHDHEAYGTLTFEEVLINSINIGIIKLSRELTADNFYRYIRAFGFGQRSGIDLPGEVKGMLKLPSEWSGLSQPSLAMGHEIGVSAIQMVLAYAALGNGGFLYKPHIVYKVEGESPRETELVRRIFDVSVTRILTPILQEVVLEGTGKKAFLESTSIAGKTGTAQKYDVNTGRYSHKAFVASFAGYFPADDPKYAMVILVDSPAKNGYYGGQVAAPAFKNIVQRIIGLPEHNSRMTIVESNSEEDPIIFVPDLTGTPIAYAKNILENYGLEYELQGDFPFVVEQYPVAGLAIRHSQLEKLIIICDNDYGKNFTMPNLKGKSLREAVYLLKLYDVQVSARGFGEIVDQWPKPGVALKQNQTVKIRGDRG